MKYSDIITCLEYKRGKHQTMAKVDMIRSETIEQLRGLVDFYNLRGILPVARAWPKKNSPPYTSLQAEAQAVFAIANADLSKITLHMLQYWRAATVGKRKQWTDDFRGIIMHYWKIYRSIPPIATDFEIIETDIDWQVKWWLFQDFIDPTIPEVYYTLQTELIQKEEFVKMGTPLYFMLRNEAGTRLVSPFILFRG